MKARGAIAFTLVAAVGLALVGCSGAQQTRAHDPAAVAGLEPSIEDKDAGLVAIGKGFDLGAYRVLAVDRVKIGEPEINDDEDRTLAAQMPQYFQAELVRRLRGTALFERVVNLAETEFQPAGQAVLKLETVITRLAPGSRALRYWVGFGAGRTKAQTETRFVDVQTGRVVLVTADRRVAAYGMFGGDSEDHLKESFDDIARDLARFLERLKRGEAPARQ